MYYKTLKLAGKIEFQFATRESWSLGLTADKHHIGCDFLYWSLVFAC